MSSVYHRVYELVRRIPSGKVLTYGLVSHLMDGRLSAQGVGWALNALAEPDSGREYHGENVPWHRVINSKGGLSTHRNADIPPGLQRHLLEQEGVLFDSDGHVNLSRYLWDSGLSDDRSGKGVTAKRRKRPE